MIKIRNQLSISNLDQNENNKDDLDKKTKQKIEQLLRERFELKKNKDFVKADSIRSKLEHCGVKIEDLQNESAWELMPTFDIEKLKDR